jgi:predicted phage terminase large subunit-like protein
VLSAAQWRQLNERPRDVVDLRAAIDRTLCEKSFSHFVRQAWPYIDPAHYLHNWHIDAIAEHLEAVMRGEIRRLLINIPPRSMKSLMCSVAFPAYVWAQEPIKGPDGVQLPTCGPHCQFFYASYAAELSTEHSVKTRDLILSPWYQSRWGTRFKLKGDANLKTKFDNDKGGKRLAASVGGISTGFGGDIIVVDDPHNTKTSESDVVRDETVRWYFEVLQTRLNDPKRGAFIVVMQRVHERDVAGEIIAREAGYVHLCLPARFESDHPFVWVRDPRAVENGGEGDGQLLWPERFGEKELEELAIMGEYGVAGQLQQRPAPRTGGFFETDKIEVIDHLPVDADGKPIKIVKRVRAWDLAATKDIGSLDPSWTVGVLMAKGENGVFYVEDVQRFRENPHEVEVRIRRTAQIDGRDVEISIPKDPGAAGKTVAEHLIRMLAGFIVKEEPQSADKAQRAKPFAAQVGGRNVKLIRASWNRAYLDELQTFPMGRHNDQVDASASAFNRLADPGKIGFIIGGGRR